MRAVLVVPMEFIFPSVTPLMVMNSEVFISFRFLMTEYFNTEISAWVSMSNMHGVCDDEDK